MNFEKVEKFAYELIDKHLWGRDWEFGFTDDHEVLGYCDDEERIICLSNLYVKYCNDWSCLEDTILHEIAHAIVGVEHYHDDKWKKVAKLLGSTPEESVLPKVESEYYEQLSRLRHEESI